jgi:hypothetical protein
MAYTGSTLLSLPVITTGTESGKWGDITNNGLTQYLDISIAGALSITSSATLANTSGSDTATNIGATTAQYRTLVVPASGPSANVVITAPSSNRTYHVVNRNATYTVQIRAGANSGVTFGVNQSGTVTYNAVSGDYELVGTIGPTVPVARGGTGLTSGTSGGIPYFSSTTAIASSAALTSGQIVLGGGAGAAPTSSSLLATSAAVTSGTYIKAIGYADTVVALGNTGTAINLDVVSGGVFTATLTGNATITLRYPVSSGASSFTLILTNDATAGRTVAWAGGSFKFPGGAASLSRTTTANAIDIWVFFTPDGGTTWYGNIAMKNMTA